ncbi:hypothetical protein [Hymenobacter volaticus]|uniref:Uncharacterized protein n=1 Tax=Hymenobacter volaticus TaxID=2932254 RepID=A0ABY4GG13_9BACT|nr:hypothetical protein [Hymenobacter volaticus]UOQ69913.1 hypothetical protein MUN86_30915 [Hymenobacter volaticus]
MPLPPVTSCHEVLPVNAALLVLVGALYASGWLLQSMTLLFLFVLVALLWSVLNFVLLVRALVTGQLRVALVYALLTGSLASLDWWLLQEVQ